MTARISKLRRSRQVAGSGAPPARRRSAPADRSELRFERTLEQLFRLGHAALLEQDRASSRRRHGELSYAAGRRLAYAVPMAELSESTLPHSRICATSCASTTAISQPAFCSQMLESFDALYSAFMPRTGGWCAQVGWKSPRGPSSTSRSMADAAFLAFFRRPHR